MLKKKIVMLGAFAVGKTSLVEQYVHSIFSEKYHTTIGVKIDQKIVELDGEHVTLLIWDIHGEDEFQKIKQSYLIGSSGYILVADGTRKHTLKTAEYLIDFAKSVTGETPFVMLINKSDLTDQWEIEDSDMEKFAAKGWDVKITSAKTGDHVEESFRLLTKNMVESK
jgi:small GTP-binding protein